MKNNKNIYCAWISVDNKPIESLAEKGSIEIDKDNVLSARFQVNENSAELYSVSLGKQFSVIENDTFTEILEAKPTQQLARLKDDAGNSNFEIVKEDLHKAIAYYLIDDSDKPGKGTGLQIVPDKKDVTDSDLIAINSKGQIYVSENVKGKVVKVRCNVLVKRKVITLNNALGPINFHVIAKEIDGTIIVKTYEGQPQKNIGVNGKNRFCPIKLQIISEKQWTLRNV